MKNLVTCLVVTAGTMLLPFASAESKVPLQVAIVGKAADTRSVVVRFENHSFEPIRLLRPLDGSEWGWHMPVYELTLSTAKREKIPIASRCGLSGLYSNLKWPDDYRIQILPGHAYEMPVDLSRPIPADGLYTVTFRYNYDPKAETVRKAPTIKYPSDLWIGEAEASPKEIQFLKNP